MQKSEVIWGYLISSAMICAGISAAEAEPDVL